MSFRASASRGSRTGGQSASAKHAYHTRQGEYLVGRDGVRDDLSATGCGNLPAFAEGDAGQFWLAADSFERANASLFIDLQLNLPAELDLAQQQAVVRAYCDRMADAERLPYSWAIHSGDGNPHVHLMLSERKTDDHDRSADQHFKRFNPAHPERGGAQKTRELQSKAWLLQARGAWAEEVNRGLVAAGHAPRFDHRSLEVRRDEALERGQWRRAAELNTLVEQHEGSRIAGMRRRMERGECDLGGLPEYAQEVIVGNDTIRAENAAYLARVAAMSDGELRLMQADDIQRLARERLSSAARSELVEFEAQEQIEHIAALEALAGAQVASVEIEVEQVHGAALLENVEWHRAQIAALEQRGAGSPPSAAIRARELQEAARRAREAAERAAADALAWRQEHPVRAALADRAGIALGVDQAAAEAQAAAVAAARAYSRSPLLIEARRWVAENRQLRQLQERLPTVERAAGIEPLADREGRSRAALDEAVRALRRASGWIENRMTRATADEARELSQMRREIEAARAEVECLREQLPEPAEAERLRDTALQHLARVDSWRPVSERPQERQEPPHERPQRGTEDAPRPPRNRGPRMG